MICEKCKKEMSHSHSHSMIDGVVTLRSVMEAMFKTYGVTQRQLRKRRRTYGLAESRALFCKLAADFTNSSLTEIGRYIDRDHTTVIHFIKAKELSGEYKKLYTLVKERLEETGAVAAE